MFAKLGRVENSTDWAMRIIARIEKKQEIRNFPLAAFRVGEDCMPHKMRDSSPIKLKFGFNI